MNTDNELLKNLDKLHTTELGALRIKRNLSLDIDTDNVVDWCKAEINLANSIITKNGKIGSKYRSLYYNSKCV